MFYVSNLLIAELWLCATFCAGWMEETSDKETPSLSYLFFFHSAS